jgi:hypothetical protein
MSIAEPMRLTDTSHTWGHRRANADALYAKMEQARATEHELALKWVANTCSLTTYDRARQALDDAVNQYLRAYDEEVAQYDVLTDYADHDAEDIEAALDDERARLRQGET